MLAHAAPPTHRTRPCRTGGDRLPDHAVQTRAQTRLQALHGIDGPRLVHTPMVATPIDSRPPIDKTYRRADVGSPSDPSSVLSIT